MHFSYDGMQKTSRRNSAKLPAETPPQTGTSHFLELQSFSHEARSKGGFGRWSGKASSKFKPLLRLTVKLSRRLQTMSLSAELWDKMSLVWLGVTPHVHFHVYRKICQIAPAKGGGGRIINGDI
jgi:hypothetical protein